ncbi:hypothetical protein PoB_001329100 [Plakobranchus ocellatus]|uniref:Uncharacterized protein n=1 Tax=Plakobranchus ocellatus TaxID=259542 RepID=A0AAV3YWM6_9GAST|nr:hypothetical protein PoB_001329100 [Plakobranchus ocellatus]
MEALGRELLRRKYTVLTTEAVSDSDPVRLRLVIARLKRVDARIILGNFFFLLAKDIFCESICLESRHRRTGLTEGSKPRDHLVVDWLYPNFVHGDISEFAVRSAKTLLSRV